jgi:hypothetical protein
LAINAKGGEIIGPKQKDHTTTLFLKTFSKKKEEKLIKRGKLIGICKNPLYS